MKNIIYFLVYTQLLLQFSVLIAQEESFKKDINEDDLGNVSDEFDDLYYKALTYKATENYDRATYALDKALKINDQQAYIYFELAKNHQNVEHYDEAEKNYKKALELAPNQKEVLEFFYKFYYIHDDFEKALTLVDQLITVDSKYEFVKVDILYQSRQFEKALQLLESINTKYGKSSERNWMRQLIYAAAAKDDSSNLEQNLLQLKKNIVENPLDEQSYLQLIIYNYEKGLPDKAFEIAKQLEEAKPDSKIVHYALYKNYLTKGDSDAAFESIMIVLKEESIGKEFKYNMVNDLLIYVKENPRMQTKLTELVEKFAGDSENDKLYMILADFSLKNKEKSSQLTYYQGREAISKNFELLKSKILIQIDFDKYGKVASLSQEGIEAYPAQPVLYLFNGMANNRLKNPKGALETLLEGLDYIIDDNKMEADFYQEIANAYTGLGNLEKAAVYMQKMEALQSKL